jgi:hypothetical protein
MKSIDYLIPNGTAKEILLNLARNQLIFKNRRSGVKHKLHTFLSYYT